jgi:hypothetical protein
VPRRHPAVGFGLGKQAHLDPGAVFRVRGENGRLPERVQHLLRLRQGLGVADVHALQEPRPGDFSDLQGLLDLRIMPNGLFLIAHHYVLG